MPFQGGVCDMISRNAFTVSRVLGRGRSAKETPFQGLAIFGRGAIFANWITMISQFLVPYHPNIPIWGDMINNYPLVNKHRP